MSTSSFELFKGRILNEIERRKARIPVLVQQAPEEQFRSTSTEALVREIAEELRFDVSFELQEDSVTQRESEAGAKGIILEVPFSGNPEVLKYQPSRYAYQLGPLNPGRIEDGCAVFRQPMDKRGAAAIQGGFEEDKKRLLVNIASLKQEAIAFNAELASLISEGIARRQSELSSHASLVTDLGFPIKRKEDAPTTYRVPVKKRRVSVSHVPTATNSQPEFVLPPEVYEDILHVIKQMASVMEKDPSAFANMQEENLRTHFLVQLNGQYQPEGAAMGEVFSYTGRTDIYIEWDGRNVFIAECAFWEGQAHFRKKIEQLLSYLTWRDTKSAVLLFNRTKSLTNVLQKIKSTIPNLDGFVRRVDYADETGFRFVLRRHDDQEREIVVTVLVFEIPNRT